MLQGELGTGTRMIYEKRHGVMLGEKELCPGKDIKLLFARDFGRKDGDGAKCVPMPSANLNLPDKRATMFNFRRRNLFYNDWKKRVGPCLDVQRGLPADLRRE
ncbi:hypothetical protein [Paenibacillus hubeiensis]|uniref:hypothetical protein n=1 Tax=Paenibacillus hubeiensis TaxID=3077330 RepID=UPI0031BB5702